ncbi:UDP-2,4-diacetamido-2,4,6-trideoxy-beta-L-altropyranose hydrolase [Hymenobacter latericus]|uniref:UDP-2,4-diacetamido-2,4, 6-trideoxy-beta-L-altropyranose hydrolase n=1 Tax=Hymenobacter sp. YIM 151858-1 TaxID=2987688 RepID=UPI0022261A9F|nr:UDP-2,4-diacetamido-2,4,6-trideoxy-beta-L-altropyranose hydrolase [Hymenobacter sp. YIM 151858-1]UYZ60584.1 UDP-2,4-diacetamido-2,4,6-trideoxy-beta-L-altropyranose hydrolase [Hymenobacter sp. YIM 151858-1]
MAAASSRLVFRADGNPRIGLGHVMRLLALADTLGEQYPTVFVVQEPWPELLQLLRATCNEVVEAPPMPYEGEPAWLAQQVLRPTDVLVLDGYGFEYTYQQAVRPHVARLVYIDDLHGFPQAADLIINPAGGISAKDYELRQPGARVLTGPRYAPLRPAFQQAAQQAAPEAPPAHTVLVCLGGADPTHQTQRIAHLLLGLEPIRQVHAVVGSAFVGWEALQSWAHDQPRLLLHRNLGAAEMCALMQQCGTAVCSPSTISYEYCAAGGGLLLVQPVADNQHDIDLFLRSSGLALPFHAAANVLTSPEADRLAQQMRQAQRRQFDGLAPQRLRQAFATLQLPAPAFRLRLATPADSDLLFGWSNDPAVRQFSFNPNPIARAEHDAWFAGRLASPEAVLLIAEDAATSRPLGLIRFAVDGPDATLSYQIAAEYRGRGLSAALLAAGTGALHQLQPQVRRVLGHVQLGNEASLRSFRRAGFAELGADEATPPESVTFAWVY